MKHFTRTTYVILIVFFLALFIAYRFFIARPTSPHPEFINKTEQNATSSETLALANPQMESASSLTANTKKYIHALLGFSFVYPASLTVSSFGSVYDAAGETILLQSDGGKKGLQILVTTFDEDITLSAARIHHDISDLTMSEVSTRTIGTGEKTAQAVVFTSTNSFMGKSLEAWFVREKRLYQVSAPVEAQGLFNSIIISWEF